MELNMVKLLITIAIILCSVSLVQAETTRPLLKDTTLFKKLVTDCKSIDVNSWQHPTKHYLINKAGVDIVWVKLCNSGKYPVFGVEFKYAPGGSTDDYFRPLYFQMLAENNYLPYAFVALLDQTVIDIRVKNIKGKQGRSTHYQFYSL